MKHFNNPQTVEELKRQYRELALKNHPDRGGNQETMKEINAEYDILFEELKNIHRSADGGFYKKETTETPSDFTAIIDKLMRMDGVEVELCGCWLWISGNTFINHEALKAAGCRYASGKKMWYWTKDEASKKGRTSTSMDVIREKYGSEKVGTGKGTYALE